MHLRHICCAQFVAWMGTSGRPPLISDWLAHRDQLQGLWKFTFLQGSVTKSLLQRGGSPDGMTTFDNPNVEGVPTSPNYGSVYKDVDLENLRLRGWEEGRRGRTASAYDLRRERPRRRYDTASQKWPGMLHPRPTHGLNNESVSRNFFTTDSRNFFTTEPEL